MRSAETEKLLGPKYPQSSQALAKGFGEPFQAVAGSPRPKLRAVAML